MGPLTAYCSEQGGHVTSQTRDECSRLYNKDNYFSILSPCTPNARSRNRADALAFEGDVRPDAWCRLAQQSENTSRRTLHKRSMVIVAVPFKLPYVINIFKLRHCSCMLPCRRSRCPGFEGGLADLPCFAWLPSYRSRAHRFYPFTKFNNAHGFHVQSPSNEESIGNR